MVVVLRQQLEMVPEDVRARILLSSNLADRGEVEEGIRHLQTAVALRPNDGASLHLLGQLRLREGEDADAAALFERVHGLAGGGPLSKMHPISSLVSSITGATSPRSICSHRA